jgi:hypothetical protein
MQDHPTAKELIRGIYGFLETDVVPLLPEPQRFHTRVAANLLKILERELELEAECLRNEADRLSRLLSRTPSSSCASEGLRPEILKLNQELCARIRAGEADVDPWRKEVMGHVRQTLIEELEIANPGMIAKAQDKY